MAITINELYTKINSLATAIGTKIKDIIATIGNKEQLATTNKTNLVNAINEVRTLANGKSSLTIANIIKDTTKATNSTYSSTKIEDYVTKSVAAAKTEIRTSILNGAEEAYDTLKEISDKIKEDNSVTSGLLDSMGNRLRVDAKMQLTDQQKRHVFDSLGFEDVDFVETFNTALGTPSSTSPGNVVTGAGSGSIGD